jgi:hypothetical protein
MVTRRIVVSIAAALAVVAALAYLRDPPWLIWQTSGLHEWLHPPGQPRYRWSGGHASFFVRADAGTFDIPVSTTFDLPEDAPMLVTVSVDGDRAARIVLTDASWQRVRIALPPPGSRKVRRIDVRTNVTRDNNRGVRVGEIELVRKVAATLLDPGQHQRAYPVSGSRRSQPLARLLLPAGRAFRRDSDG